jgi:cation:H+ antiporter
MLMDGELTGMDAWAFLGVFAALMVWTIREGLQHRSDPLAGEMAQELDAADMPLRRALLWVAIGLVF